VREFEAQRRWMHERYLARVQASGAPWLLVEGPPHVRLDTTAVAVERLLDRA
jgi:hypothetical protein